MTLEAWDYCRSPFGKLELTLANTSTRNESFSFTTAPPADNDDGARESNPFYMSAGTDPGKAGKLMLTLFSAGLLSVKGQTNKKPYLQQYWDLDYVRGRLTGELVDDGRELGGAYNNFFDDDSLVPCQPHQGVIRKPCSIREGTTLVGDLSHKQMTMTVGGRNYDEARRFKIEATATRS